MVPSPDWIVGLSKENLCLANCSWVDNRVIDLYPWDTGTDGGLRYDGASNPQRPKGNMNCDIKDFRTESFQDELENKEPE
mgnify:CR=1 FL=1